MSESSTLMSEPLVNLHAICRRVPEFRPGHPTSYSTVLRWVVRGVRGPNGDTIRLEAIKLSGRWVTSLPAFQRFMEHLAPRFELSHLGS